MGEKLERVKTHIQEHKTVYITAAVGGACLAVGAVGGLLLSDRVKVTAIAIGKNNTIIQETTTVLARRGHPGNIIRCDQTGEIFASQARCAELLGLDPGNLSKHLKGSIAHLNGLTFEKLGEAQ